MPRRAPALLMLLSASLPLSAQSLNQTAAVERKSRETAVAVPSRVFTDEDLRRYAGQRVSEAASPLASDPQPAASDALPSGAAPRPDAFGRHSTSAEAYVRRCEERLRTATENELAASEASQTRAATRLLLAVEDAARALERARTYRDRAVAAARVAGALPVGPR